MDNSISSQQQTPSQRQLSSSHPPSLLRVSTPDDLLRCHFQLAFLFHVQQVSPSQVAHGPRRPSILTPILDKDEEGEDGDGLERIELVPHDSHPIHPQKSKLCMSVTVLSIIREHFLLQHKLRNDLFLKAFRSEDKRVFLWYDKTSIFSQYTSYKDPYIYWQSLLHDLESVARKAIQSYDYVSKPATLPLQIQVNSLFSVYRVQCQSVL